MNYLLDTCVFADFFKKIPAVVNHFESISPKQIYISSISVMEVEYGLKLNPEKDLKIRPIWSKLLKLICVINYSSQCAEATAHIRALLKVVGSPIGPYDCLIAGSALANGMTVVTSNLSEFKCVPDLHIENWRVAS